MFLASKIGLRLREKKLDRSSRTLRSTIGVDFPLCTPQRPPPDKLDGHIVSDCFATMRELYISISTSIYLYVKCDSLCPAYVLHILKGRPPAIDIGAHCTSPHCTSATFPSHRSVARSIRKERMDSVLHTFCMYTMLSTSPSDPRSPISCLPVELLRSILMLVLAVRDDAFTSPCTRFGQRTRSSAQYLLVSKWWLVVCIPLLYRTVVLRSAAQVYVLRTTLLKHPELGLLVRNLRIEEGTYYSGLGQVLKRTPQVESLVLSLVVYSAVDASTLCDALSHLSPQKIVLHDLGSTITRNRSMDQVVEALCRMIKGSNYLDTFEWRVQWRSKVFALPRTNCFADALVQARRLRVVAVSSSRNVEIPVFIGKLFDKSKVEEIRVVDCPVRMKRKIRVYIASKQSVRDRVKFYDQFNEESNGKGNKLQVHPLTDNAANLPQLPDCITKRIIEIALFSLEVLDEALFSDGLDETGLYAFRRMFCALTRVSKFFKSVVRPFRFLHISITDFYHGMLFLQGFLRESDLGAVPLVHSVYINSYPRTVTGMECQARNIVLNALCSMPQLTELTLPACPADIRLLARYLGCTLSKLDIYLDSHLDHICDVDNESFILYPDYFAGFDSLEVLWLRCRNSLPPIANSVVRGYDKNSIAAKKLGFGRLRVLTIQDYEDCRVFELIAHWDLSTVKRLSIAGSLETSSKSESARVYNIIGSVQDNGGVETLVLGSGTVNPDFEMLSRSLSATTLKKIELCFTYGIDGIHTKSTVLPFFERLHVYLDSVPKGSRNLEEIQIRSVFKWPYTDSEIRRSVWPKCLDTLIHGHGISVTNYRGIPWRPRLQIV